MLGGASPPFTPPFCAIVFLCADVAESAGTAQGVRAVLQVVLLTFPKPQALLPVDYPSSLSSVPHLSLRAAQQPQQQLLFGTGVQFSSGASLAWRQELMAPGGETRARLAPGSGRRGRGSGPQRLPWVMDAGAEVV